MDARVKEAHLDPVTLEVIRNALPAISNEMAIDLQRTSYNMIIYEVRDFCTALVLPNGELVSQNVGGVSHFIADLGVMITDAMEQYTKEGFKPGDVLVSNHQRVAGQPGGPGQDVDLDVLPVGAREQAARVGVGALADDHVGGLDQLDALGTQHFAAIRTDQLAALKVSRSNESEADESGTRYEGAIGRNPMGIAKFFSRMSDQIPDWISTHPAPEDRVAAVTAEVNGDATLKAIAADSARTNYKSRFVQYAKDPNL